MIANFGVRMRVLGLALLWCAATTLPASGQAAIVIVNANAPGVGFNDPTPAAPVGGNTGTTLGQQRLIAFQHAAQIWGATVRSVPAIYISATMEPMTCTATSAVLGSAGPVTAWANVPGLLPGTWYHAALANARSALDLDGTAAEIRARFNSRLGESGCLTGIPFYLGLDGNHGPYVDMVTVLLHEFAHGLGFSTLTSGTTGAQFIGLPSAFDHFLFDNTLGLLWPSMTDAQRAASALNTRRVAWVGPNVSAEVPNVLQPGTPELVATAPASLAGTYLVGTASFGPPLSSGGVSGEVMPVVDQANGTGLACTALSAANRLAVAGKIALIDRGACTFPVKVKNAQDAGAIGVIIVDNVAGSPPPSLGGTDPTVTIPSVRITQADGATFKTALRTRSRTRSGVMVNMLSNLATYAGADAAGRALMYTPNPFQSGSSVSHWDTLHTPNLLMEPSINSDLSQAVKAPRDLTFQLLRDIGWNP